MSEKEQVSIFISRGLEAGSRFLKELTRAGHKVIHKSLIKITPIRFTYSPESDWIFFSSKNGIKCFFDQNPQVNKDVKFGVISKASADYLKELGYEVTFIGQGTDVRKIASDFSGVIGNESVLFPQAIDSLQSIQKQIAFSNTCFNLYVYKTTPLQSVTIPDADILAFTSPSNARAYFNQHSLRAGQSVVAIGPTTLNCLKDLKITDAIVATEFSEDGLLEVVKELIREGVGEG